MSIDDLARAAAADLRAATERETDAEWMLRALHRTRTRRRAAVAAAAAAALAIILSLAISPWSQRQALPAQRSPSPAQPEMLLSNPVSAATLAGGDASRVHLPSPSPDTVYSLAFSPDGTELAYGSRDVKTMNTVTGTIRVLFNCQNTDSCTVDWSPDGRTIVAADGSHLRVIDMASGQVHDVPLPPGWSGVASPDVNAAGRIVMLGNVDGAPAILNIDLTGTHPQVVQPLPRTTGAAIDPRWSPDGTLIGFILLQGPLEFQRDSPLTLRIMNADGSNLRTLAAIGHCICMNFTPGFDWSPSGRMAVAAMGTPQTTANAVFEVGPAGTLTFLDSGQGPIAWRPAS
jgi:hypothetical protein